MQQGEIIQDEEEDEEEEVMAEYVFYSATYILLVHSQLQVELEEHDEQREHEDYDELAHDLHELPVMLANLYK